MFIFKNIYDYLKTPKGQRNVLLVFIVFLIIFFRSCNNSKINNFKYEQNISALTDSIRSYKSKNGVLIYEKKSLISDKKELGKKLKYLKDNPIVVVQYETIIEHDTTEIPVYVDNGGIVWGEDSIYKKIPANWSKDTIYNQNNYRKLAGDFIISIDTSSNVKIENFLVTKDVMAMSFKTGITENKNNELEIFIQSDYPGFKPTMIEGSIIDPTQSKVIKKFFPPKRLGIGVYGGYGMYIDPNKFSFGSGLTFGLGISYNLFQWRRKK